MTLLELTKVINVTASRQLAVNMVVENDVFRINTYPDSRYGVFAWTQNQHTRTADSDFIECGFTFFYVDRLKADHSNQVEIQSVGLQTLTNIILTLDEMGLVSGNPVTYQVFNQRFADECAGVFCQVMLQIPLESTCAELYPDFNDDFNDDFLII